MEDFCIFLDWNTRPALTDTDPLFADKSGALIKDILESVTTLKEEHTYILDPFSMEVRVSLNKKVKANQEP